MSSFARRKIILFWDFLVWILFFFPLLAGGIWISRPGLKLEHTQITIPVLVLGALGYILHHKKFDLKDTSSYRFIDFLWKKWVFALQNNPLRTISGATISVFLLYFFAAYFRHLSFGTHAGDLGIGSGAMWNLAHGNGYISSVKDGMNFFADHQQPIHWLLAPLLILFSDASVTVLFLQSLWLACSGFALFLLAHRHLSDFKWVAYLPLLLWAYRPLRDANLFEFHAETAMIPLFLFGAYGIFELSTKKFFFGLFCLILALTTKESAPLVLTGFCISLLLGVGPENLNIQKRNKKVAVALLVLALSVFYIDLNIIPKLAGGGQYYYTKTFSHLGDTKLEVALSPLLHPIKFWSHLLDFHKIKFLIWLFLPTLFLPFVNWKWIPMFLPGLLLPMMDESHHRTTPGMHYGTEATAGIFLAFLFLIQKPNSILKKIPWFVFIFFACLQINRSEIHFIRKFYPDHHHKWLKETLRNYVSPMVSVSASGSITPHVIERKWAHHLPKIQTPLDFTGTEKVDCILFDSSVNNVPFDPNQFENWKSTHPEYRSVYQCKSFEVLQYESASNQCLKTIPECEDQNE